MSQVNREYKSTIFAMLFSDKEKLKSLCEAVSGEKIESADDIIINTLSDEDGVQSGFYARLKNDVSFIFSGSQHLYEHQSTWSANMPVRMFLYYAELILKEHPPKTMYSSKTIALETPRFVVFYNGVDQKGDFDEMTLTLSSHFIRKEENPAVELLVKVYNINKGYNQELMDACETMRQYSDFVAMSREAMVGVYGESAKKAAMEQVLDRCLEQGILVDFISDNREAIIMQHFWEFDEQAYEDAIRADGFDDGFVKGKEEGKVEGVEEGREPMYALVEKGRLTLQEAAEECKLSEGEFVEKMTSAGYKIPSEV